MEPKVESQKIFSDDELAELYFILGKELQEVSDERHAAVDVLVRLSRDADPDRLDRHTRYIESLFNESELIYNLMERINKALGFCYLSDY